MRWHNDSVFYHEFWHIVNYILYNYNNKFRQEFNNKFIQLFDDSGRDDFITEYAKTNVFEDFAVIFENIINWNIQKYEWKTYLLDQKINFIKKWIK